MLQSQTGCRAGRRRAFTPRTAPSAGARRQRGFSLVEVLVAALILAFGLVGLAHLQVTALRGNLGAHHRSQVALLAHDMLDRLRADPAGAWSGAYDVALDAQPLGDSRAAAEVAAWKRLLDERVRGDGAVACTAADGRCLLTIVWPNTAGGDALLAFPTRL